MSVSLAIIQPQVSIVIDGEDPQVLTAIDADTLNGVTAGATGLLLLATATAGAARTVLGVDSDDAVTFGALTAPSLRASTSGGLLLLSSNGTTVATIGAGPGTGVTFAGGVNMQALGCTTVTASGDLATSLGSPSHVGTETRGAQIKYSVDYAAIRCGGSDTVPLDDARNFWRGLPSANAWGNSANTGLFSAVFNRNGAAYATYSSLFGHDCVAYGVASVASGAGSCTGDPDNPTSTNFEGYCALASGKNVQALGSKSAALCEETLAKGRAAFAAGYFSIAGSSITETGTIALGHLVTAAGDGMLAAGKWITASGSIGIGSGVSDGSRMVVPSGKLGLGMNVSSPTVELSPGSGGYGSVLIRGQLSSGTADGAVGLDIAGASGHVAIYPYYDGAIGAYFSSRVIDNTAYAPLTWQASVIDFYISSSGKALGIAADRSVTFAAGITHGSATLLTTSVSLTNGAGAAAGTLLNAPSAGNPSKWIPINDNGTIRYVPSWT
jgi:hypothetical protein